MLMFTLVIYIILIKNFSKNFICSSTLLNHIFSFKKGTIIKYNDVRQLKHDVFLTVFKQ